MLLNWFRALGEISTGVVEGMTGGKHNRGSLHARGRAADVRTRGVSSAKLNAFIRDERVRPHGQKCCVAFPFTGNGRVSFGG